MSNDPCAVTASQLVGTLSLAQDSAFGQPLESELRTCLLSVWLADALGCNGEERADTYYTALLRYVGCTGHAFEASAIFGDEIAARARSALHDPSNPAEVLVEIVKYAGRGRSFPERLRVLASVLAGGKRVAADNFRGGCEVADRLVEGLGMTSGVRQAIGCAFERFNGQGFPNGITGEAIPLPMRIVHLTQEMEALQRFGGTASAIQLAKKRASRAYDPVIAKAFVQGANALFERLERASPWGDVLALDPVPRRLEGDELDGAMRIVADFVDTKSPFTLGHSRGVGELAAAAGEACGLGETDRRLLLRAGYVHDLGRCGIPNSIWDKPGPLSHAERDRVRVHALVTEQILGRTPAWDGLRALAASHHERWDGSGYHRGLRSPEPPIAARLLACADIYHALTEVRPTRPALDPSAAAKELRSEAARGVMDREAVEAVLAGAGHDARPHRARPPAGLTERELEVLRLVARGLTTKEVGSKLGISTKTADHHIQHVYGKIGVTTRAAAALFAAQQRIV